MIRNSSSRTLTVVILLVLTGYCFGDYILGHPVITEGPVNSNYMDGYPCISEDGLSLYFTSNRPGGSGVRDIWVVSRDTIDDSWGYPENLGEDVNSAFQDETPNITADNLTLFFTSDCPGGQGKQDIWMCHRETVNSPWSVPVNVGSNVNGAYDEHAPSISHDGLTLYFSSSRRTNYYFDLWMATRDSLDSEWQSPVMLGQEVNHLTSDDITPNISRDGLILFFTSNRPGGLGVYLDIWQSTRASIEDSWSQAVKLEGSINMQNPIYDVSPWLSINTQTLYFTSNRPGTSGWFGIWQVPVLPVQKLPDFTDEGEVNLMDLYYLAEYWADDQTMCDIAPAPNGDGIINFKDFAILAKYWLKDPSLIAHWKLDEDKGSFAHDSAGYSHGILGGSPVWSPYEGRIKGTLLFDGIDDYISAYDLCSNVANTDVTFTAWIKSDLTSKNKFFCAFNTVSGENRLLLGQQASNPNLMLVDDEGWRDSGTVVFDGTWHHVAFVLSIVNDTMTIFVDGASARSYPTTTMIESDDVFSLGQEYDAGMQTGDFYNGLIDEVRIYDRTLSSEEIAELAEHD